MNLKSYLVVGLSALFLVSACGKKEAPPPPPPPAPAPAPAPVKEVAPAPVSFKAVTLGNKIGEDKKVAAPLTAFAPKDTIYAVVETDGTGKAAIKAVWTFHKGDKTAPVSDATQTIEAKGPAFTEFHVVKPSGWPAGDYKVEIFLDDKSVNTQSFTVK